MGKITKHIENVPVYDGEIVYFDDWMVNEFGKNEEAARDDMLYNDLSPEEIDEKIYMLKDQFYDWCEERNLSGFEV